MSLASADDALPGALLGWYDRHRRVLPWRAPAGRRADPYHVWLSEIMLQQTTVATVKTYFDDFVARWPRVEDLAAADLDDVLHAWQGLGYYARARNLHKCAKAVAGDHGGRFPDTEAGLLALPGVGPYTAAAIAAIAFDVPASPVDGNIERVTARLRRITEPLPGGKKAIQAAARDLTPNRRPGDFAQAMMDLGAMVCTPRAPKCDLCPWRDPCAARAAGDAEELPARPPKKAKPTRHGVVFWINDAQDRVLLRRRAERGLLGGMMEVPSTDWREDSWNLDEASGRAPLPAAAWAEAGEVRHTFTHFHLRLTVVHGTVAGGDIADGIWVHPSDFGAQALPTLMKKVVKAALG
ncbi:A/G-specific adenine glycosylase [Thalassospiraceae bacterium LMO-SO8]|nr:A/G-specific adenine glycosylase [Alphaproteobacteria bacterium LMO-S08]WND74810.1 A/G-specific adenine glycosylase [Thalassospiraceae bacterium LMO-SO8]